MVNMARRVVVTGIGIISPLGTGTKHVWQRLILGHCGLTALNGQEYAKLPSRVAGVVPIGKEEGQLSLETAIEPSELRTMSKASAFALIAANDALTDANWKPNDEKGQHNTGVAVGMGMASLDDIVATGEQLRLKGMKGISPYFVPKILTNMAAGLISIRHQLKGPNHSVSTACATGLHAVGDAFRFIQRGDANVMVCGGTEACVNALAVAGFARMRALATKFNDSPSEASRPFDADRDGFVIAEGAAILVLEELSHAKKRGAPTIYAELLGYGLSADANHISAPSDSGEGAFWAMKRAIQDSRVPISSIGYVNAHATSTPLGDRAENTAIKRLFVGAKRPAVSSIKGAVGHLLGAAGSLEAAVTVLSVHHGILPPTINLKRFDSPEFDLNYVPRECQKWTASSRVALTNSFGFGGTNAALCLRNYESESDSEDEDETRRR